MHEKRTDNGYTLLLTTRQLSCEAMFLVKKSHTIQKFLSLGYDFFLVTSLSFDWPQNQILQDVQMREEVITLKDHSDFLTNQVKILLATSDRLAIQENIASLDGL